MEDISHHHHRRRHHHQLQFITIIITTTIIIRGADLSINQSIFVYSEHQADRTQLVTLVSHIFIHVFICMSPCPFWISFNLI